MRHLRTRRDAERTLCGLTIEAGVVPACLGLRDEAEQVVHYSHARSGKARTLKGKPADCAACRGAYRKMLHEARSGPPYDAATATGMYDHD